METTIKDVAKYAGVGVGTVSRVINNEKAVGDKTRKKVLEAMKALNYSRNNMAFRLRKNETRIIALLVPVINHPFFAKIAYYIEDEASKFGYSVILVSSQQKVEKETEIITKIKHREVDGVFVSGYTLSQFFYEAARDLGKKIPEDLQIISYDGTFTQWGTNEIICIEQPIEEMASQVVRLLVKKIHGEETGQRTVLKTKFVLGTSTK